MKGMTNLGSPTVGNSHWSKAKLMERAATWLTKTKRYPMKFTSPRRLWSIWTLPGSNIWTMRNQVAEVTADAPMNWFYTIVHQNGLSQGVGWNTESRELQTCQSLRILTFNWPLCLHSLVETCISILSRAWPAWFVPITHQRPTYCKNLWLAFTTKIWKEQAVETQSASQQCLWLDFRQGSIKRSCIDFQSWTIWDQNPWDLWCMVIKEHHNRRAFNLISHLRRRCNKLRCLLLCCDLNVWNRR